MGNRALKPNLQLQTPRNNSSDGNRYQSRLGSTSQNERLTGSKSVEVRLPKTYAQQVSQHLPLSKKAQQTLNKYTKDINRSQIAKQIKDSYQLSVYLIKSKKSTFSGSFKNFLPHGRGTVHFSDGSFHHGLFVSGQAQGLGIYIYPDGSIYQGNFNKSVFSGQGTLIYRNGQVRYEGNFKNSLPDGLGIQVHSSGDHYKGYFKNGLKDGQGTYYWPDGKKYIGAFSNGVMEGWGAIYSQGEQGEEEKIFEGRFQKGGKVGYGVLRTRLGVYEGQFQNDLLNGQGSFMWNDGKVYQGEFYNGMMHGLGTIYYPSNQIAEGIWENNHYMDFNQLRNDPVASSKIAQIKARHLYTPKPEINHPSNSSSSSMQKSKMKVSSQFSRKNENIINNPQRQISKTDIKNTQVPRRVNGSSSSSSAIQSKSSKLSAEPSPLSSEYSEQSQLGNTPKPIKSRKQFYRRANYVSQYSENSSSYPDKRY